MTHETLSGVRVDTVCGSEPTLDWAPVDTFTRVDLPGGDVIDQSPVVWGFVACDEPDTSMPLARGAEECGVAIPRNAPWARAEHWFWSVSSLPSSARSLALLDVSSGERRVNVVTETMTERQAHVTLLT